MVLFLTCNQKHVSSMLIYGQTRNFLFSPIEVLNITSFMKLSVQYRKFTNLFTSMVVWVFYYCQGIESALSDPLSKDYFLRPLLTLDANQVFFTLSDFSSSDPPTTEPRSSSVYDRNTNSYQSLVNSVQVRFLFWNLLSFWFVLSCVTWLIDHVKLPCT